MIILYGAGIEYLKLIESKIWDFGNKIVVVDSDTNKVGKTIGGYVVQDKAILEKCTSEDYVYITSTTYRDSILETIHSINANVKIADKRAMRWLLNQIHRLPIEMSQDEYYESAKKEDIDRWIEDALDEEMKHWRWMVPKMRDEKDKALYSREFRYPYNPEISFKNEDIIVDVGCGPIPKFGNLIGGKQIKYYPVDPLSVQYNRLLEESNVVVPVQPQFAIMEALTCFFDEESVDYCIVNNALDHSIDILRAFIECLRIVKVGGCFLLEHWEAEAISNDYEGLHKWNIEEENNELIFFSQNMKVNVSKLLNEVADIEIKRGFERDVHRDIIIVKVTKIASVSKELLEKWDKKSYIGNIIERLFERLV